MNEMLKGNYKVKQQDKPKEAEAAQSLESLFESSAMEKLGGSMAFVKKSASFTWKGDPSKK